MRLLFVLLQGEVKEAINWLTAIVGGLLGLALGVGGFLITRTYYRSGLEEKLTTKYKGLYEAEAADNKRLEGERSRALEAKAQAERAAAIAESERLDILSEYTQLTQLFAKKSIILENITGLYSRFADALQVGNPESLTALVRFLAPNIPPGGGDDIHKTNPGGGS